MGLRQLLIMRFVHYEAELVAGYAKTDLGGSEILHSFYVDDMCGGGVDEESVIKIYEDVSAALESIGMKVRK